MVRRRRKSSQTDLSDSCPGNESALKDLQLLSRLIETCACVRAHACVIVLFKAAHVSAQLQMFGSFDSGDPAVPKEPRCGAHGVTAFRHSPPVCLINAEL